jgi:hypothetical protein
MDKKIHLFTRRLEREEVGIDEKCNIKGDVKFNVCKNSLILSQKVVSTEFSER